VKNQDLTTRKLCLHGLGVELSGGRELLGGYVERLLRPFEVSDLPEKMMPVVGQVSGYEEGEVLKCLSSRARRVSRLDPCLEVYQDGERFWVVDERWGICEINLLGGRWRSWILPRATADAVRVAEGAVLWPMAQLLRLKGLHLLPAVAVAREGWGALLLAPFSIEPELTRLLKEGYRLIGQRWAGLREEEGRIELLRMAGVMERLGPPRLRHLSGGDPAQWVDLEREYPQARQHHAFCEAVMIVEPGRRAVAHGNELSAAEAQEMLKCDWPIVEIHPSRRVGQLLGRLSQKCRCVQVQLSREAGDLLVLMESLRRGASGPVPQVSVFVNGERRRAGAA
jgi:hypothetical protein